uniref:Uncharacterized protein n=1 Tax=Triticum urartu TaxID=4572 RepID=A0A8R7TBZ3_TRIUA
MSPDTRKNNPLLSSGKRSTTASSGERGPETRTRPRKACMRIELWSLRLWSCWTETSTVRAGKRAGSRTSKKSVSFHCGERSPGRVAVRWRCPLTSTSTNALQDPCTPSLAD